ncbi:MAG TPA: ribosome maturation factor RimM [Oscillospiraceae bacterium]|nr:ribosome maturation factor RimM [Oscillospiraceae bacterium]HPF56494.1 ribosome maturation factor RimM [Clostridiales bacterium]HPK36589.1 ribosome maturation factor RimM [Oscillospiraceae bacterium]HPR76793.1 ribosome maturation factor RimM [Oscillospiraceae bacterium]
MHDYLEIGKIVSSHGLRGEFKVDLWCDGLDFAAQFKTLYLGAQRDPLTIISWRGTNVQAIVKAEGYDHIDTAKTLVGKTLWFARKDAVLPDGSFFEDDLIGLSVVDSITGIEYGKLTNIYRTGANDVYAVQDKNSAEKLLPAIPQVVNNIDLKAGKITITPIPGIFDDEG